MRKLGFRSKAGEGGLGEEGVSIHTIMFTTASCQPQLMYLQAWVAVAVAAAAVVVVQI